MMNLKTLNEFNYINQPVVKAVKNFNEWLSKNKPDNTNELPHPKLLGNYLNDIYMAINLFGQDLGYGFENRLPNKEQIHLVSAKDYSKLISNKNNNPDSSRAVCSPHFKDIYIKWDKKRTIFGTIAIIQHELIHQISSKNVYINPETGNFLVLLGYGLPYQKDYKRLTEIITEIINQHIIDNYWPNFSKLKNIGRGRQTNIYGEERQIINRLLIEMAKSKEQDYNYFLIELIKEMMEGKNSFANKLNNLFENLVQGTT